MGGQSFATSSNRVVCRDCTGKSWVDGGPEPTTDHRGCKCYGMIKFPDLPIVIVGYKEDGDLQWRVLSERLE